MLFKVGIYYFIASTSICTKRTSSSCKPCCWCRMKKTLCAEIQTIKMEYIWHRFLQPSSVVAENPTWDHKNLRSTILTMSNNRSYTALHSTSGVPGHGRWTGPEARNSRTWKYIGQQTPAVPSPSAQVSAVEVVDLVVVGDVVRCFFYLFRWCFQPICQWRFCFRMDTS